MLSKFINQHDLKYLMRRFTKLTFYRCFSQDQFTYQSSVCHSVESAVFVMGQSHRKLPLFIHLSPVNNSVRSGPELSRERKALLNLFRRAIGEFLPVLAFTLAARRWLHDWFPIISVFSLTFIFLAFVAFLFLVVLVNAGIAILPCMEWSGENY